MRRHPQRESGRWLWPLGACLATGVYALIPMLSHPAFYMRGDTGTQFAPTWFHLGELLRAGTWPIWIDPDAWAGGNYVGEALFGVYNPLNALIWLVVSGSSNLLTGVYLVKGCVLVMLALGTYLVSREYGAARWASAVMATALPVSGFTLYWETPSWPAGLIAFAYTPWVWWSFRRAMRGTLNPFWAFVVGALTVTNGNPYGTLGVVVVGVALLIEAAAQRQWRGAVRLALFGGCVAALLPLVYLPLLSSVDLSYRVSEELFANGGNLRPDAGDLFGLSSPTFVPGFNAFARPIRVPATYFCWFVVPLLPWFRFAALRSARRSLTGIAVLGVFYLATTIGPSKLWMFRWPIRLVEYLELALAVGLAVLLSKGLHRDHWRGRLLGTAGLLLFTSWLTWSQNPSWHRAALVGPLLVCLLTAGLMAWHRWGPAARASLALPLMVGTACVVATQSLVFPVNSNLHGWRFPNSVTALQDRFGHREGPLVQFVDAPGKREGTPAKRWRYFLGGSMYAVTGVVSVNTYSGMGYGQFTKTLCIRFNGFTRPCGGFARLWKPLAPGEPPLADLIKVQTVVATPSQAKGAVPVGWAVERRPVVVTVRRESPLPYPNSHLAWATAGVDVQDARTVDAYHETVSLATTGNASHLTFAMLDWPGYEATFDGGQVEIGHNAAGLVTVDLPANSSGRLDITYRPPGLVPGLAAAGAGTLGAVVMGVLFALRRRRGRAAAAPTGEQPAV